MDQLTPMDKWQKALLDACMATESCYVENDPVATLNNLISWHVELAREDMVSVWKLVAIRDRINALLTDSVIRSEVHPAPEEP